MKHILAAVLALFAMQSFAQPITCTEPKACEKMWSNAQIAVGKLSGMPIRLLTDSRIETYPSNNPGIVSATVLKVPQGEGYEIQYSFACMPRWDCKGVRTLREEYFPKMVRDN